MTLEIVLQYIINLQLSSLLAPLQSTWHDLYICSFPAGDEQIKKECAVTTAACWKNGERGCSGATDDSKVPHPYQSCPQTAHSARGTHTHARTHTHTPSVSKYLSADSSLLSDRHATLHSCLSGEQGLFTMTVWFS